MLIRHVFILGLKVCLTNCYGRTAREWQVCVFTVVVSWKSLKQLATIYRPGSTRCQAPQ